uniref:WAP domain-containing protein n=1 Tax=Ascaris lumbricoides TaxID=6252 RepID=A0A0M3HJ51_ASCLU
MLKISAMMSHSLENFSVAKGGKDERLGVCPRNIPVDEKCRNECTSDSDCPEFEKCCMTNCGRLCQFPYIATGSNLFYVCVLLSLFIYNTLT